MLYIRYFVILCIAACCSAIEEEEEPSSKYIENTMLVSYDIKFITQDQKRRRNGEACRASPACFWSSLINLISNDTYAVFYLSCIINIFNCE